MRHQVELMDTVLYKCLTSNLGEEEEGDGEGLGFLRLVKINGTSQKRQ